MLPDRLASSLTPSLLVELSGDGYMRERGRMERVGQVGARPKGEIEFAVEGWREAGGQISEGRQQGERKHSIANCKPNVSVLRLVMMNCVPSFHSEPE